MQSSNEYRTEAPRYVPGHVIMDVIEDHRMEAWCHLWRPGESMWRGTIPKSRFHFHTDSEIITDVKNFFDIQGHLMQIPDDYEWNASCDDESHMLENFVKLVWLTAEYFSVGFHDPLGAHWNPRANSVCIHPGGCRNKVIKLFHPADQEVDVHFFNTGGFYVDWMQNLEPITDPEYFTKKGWVSGVTPDHGTLIPHPMCPYGAGVRIFQGKKFWYEKICSLLDKPDFAVWIDEDLGKASSVMPYLEPWLTTDKHKAWVVVDDLDSAIRDIDIAALTMLILARVETKYLRYSVRWNPDLGALD